MDRKLSLVQKAINVVDLIGEIALVVKDIKKSFSDNEYYSTGFNEITTEEIQSHTGINATDLADIIDMFNQIDNLFSNQPVEQRDWQSIINKTRSTY